MRKHFHGRWRGEGGGREVLRVAIPLVLSTSAWSVQHFVDRMFLVWYAPEAIAAAMPAGILNFTIMSFFIGTASYVSTFVAQYYGARMNTRIGPVLWQGIYVSLLGGVVMFLFIPAAPIIFTLVGHEPLVRESEIVYFQYLCLGGMPVIAASALAGFFSGRGRTWPVMWVNTFATAVNLFLDYLLIFGKWGLPEMGIRGAAIATVISAFFSLIVYIALLSRSDYNRAFHTMKGWRLEKALFYRLVRFGVPSGIQFFLDMAGFTAFILILGRLGTVSLAATNIAFNINTLAFMPMIGFGIAISVLVGQYLGKQQPDLAQRSVYSGFVMTLIYMTTLAALYVIVPNLFVAPFAAKADPEEFAEIYRLTIILLRFVALYSVFDAMNIIFSSAIKGAGDTRFVMYMIVIISVCVLVVPTYVAIMVLDYGLMAGWTFASIYVIALSFAFYFRFLGGKWKTMRVIEEPVPVICAGLPECPAAKLEP
ncbi:MAG TPA: MATE family efflux transporter [Deltaproteobacteria bacterium]|nr:MATE family efflux transporter [Deltaproteobacteria bacterium]